MHSLMKGYWKVWAVEGQGTEADVPIGLVQVFWVYVWDLPTSVDAWVQNAQSCLQSVCWRAFDWPYGAQGLGLRHDVMLPQHRNFERFKRRACDLNVCFGTLGHSYIDRSTAYSRNQLDLLMRTTEVLRPSW